MNRPSYINGVRVPYETSVPKLIASLLPPGPRAWAACIALGHSATPEALNLLTELLADPDWRYRRCAIEALSAHPRAPSAAARILTTLSDPSPYVIRAACETVAKLRLQKAHDLVVNLLSSSDFRTREAAVRTLSSIWQPADGDLLFQVLANDRSKLVRVQAAWSLAANASSATWHRLFNTWIHDPLPRHRVWACDLVYRFGDAAAKAQLRPLLNDSDGHVRKAAKRVLQPG